jgi:hypothetical protein
MKTRLLLAFLLFGVAPLWSQVEPSASGGSTTTEDNSRMTIPPSVSGEAYPTSGVSEERSNFLSGGVTFVTAYNDNVFAGGTMKPVGDTTFSVLPTIMLDQTTPRQHSALTYSAGFLFYDPTSALNSVEQSGALNYRYRFSPGTTLSLYDSFQQSSNVFSSTSPLSGAQGAGAGGPDGVFVIAPFANQYANSANVVLSYQFGQDGMIGGTGSSTILNYPNLSQVPGLYNSMAEGGSGFYSRRLTGAQYMGVTYKYLRYTTDPVESDTTTNTVSFFYSTHLNRSLSMSVSVGPQYHSSSEGGGPTSQSWGPAVIASVGWRGEHTSLGARYARSVYGGGGLLGTYETDSVSGSAHWQMERTWSVGANAIYSNSRNVDSLEALTSPGGDTASGTVSLQHRLGEHFDGELGYARLHQSYNSIVLVSTAPDSDRVYISVSYQFTRPLGR